MSKFYQKILELLLGSEESHYSYDELLSCLETKFSKCDKNKIKFHIDHCKSCWDLWNKARWDAAADSKGIKELESYLGDSFKEYYDSSIALAEDWTSSEPKSKDEVNGFYKKNTDYLYNLTIWYESGDRPDFASEIEKVAKEYNLNSFIDFGCGVGNDGLKLIEKGYDVTFADFECPSVDFLRWRARERKVIVDFLNIEFVEVYPEKDVFFAIDVLEHVLDPLDVIDRINPSTKMFIHHSEFNDIAGGRHPFHFNFDIRQLNARLIDAGFKEKSNKLFSVWIRK